MAYVLDDGKFDGFRTGADWDRSEGGWAGGDAAYGKVESRDAEHAFATMQECELGRELLMSVLPRIAGRIDGFGSPPLVGFQWNTSEVEFSGFLSVDLLA